MNKLFRIDQCLKLAQRWEILKTISTSKFIPNKLEALKRVLSYRQCLKETGFYIDIGNVCNSKCIFCSTGNKNRNGCAPTEKGHFMDFELFKKILDYLEKQHFLHTNNNQMVALYNWGEPMLHPEFERFMDYITRKKRHISLSTNGIFLPKFSDKFDASCVSFFRLSMCGFSQKSYDKIFMSDFEQCKKNIASVVHEFRAHGCIGYFTLIFHVYQFNTHEIKAAAEFARSLHIGFWPVWAFLVDGERALKYHNRELPVDYLTLMSQYLFHGSHPRGPVNTCSFTDICINPDGDLNVCVMFPKPIGSLFNMTPESLQAYYATSEFCKTCKAAGVPRIQCEDNDEFDLPSLSYFL
ncbi:MAG: radical SAM protein [Opitutales bacterium]|nr:radical SAM protein [Opitutales bacterium]